MNVRPKNGYNKHFERLGFTMNSANEINYIMHCDCSVIKMFRMNNNNNNK